jgi:hypothetical protein
MRLTNGLFFLALLLASCGGTPTKKAVSIHKIKAETDWGYFSGPVDARWDDDGRNMTILSELRYTDPHGVVWIAPAGSRVDGASIPKAFWSVIGGPFEGKYRKPSVLHDVAYDEKSRPWKECDRMFYEAMRCAGVGSVEAKTMYYALLRHGMHWKFKSKRAKPVNTGTSDESPRDTAIAPGEVDAIQQWVQKSDPDLAEIESRASGGNR